MKDSAAVFSVAAREALKHDSVLRMHLPYGRYSVNKSYCYESGVRLCFGDLEHALSRMLWWSVYWRLSLERCSTVSVSIMCIVLASPRSHER